MEMRHLHDDVMTSLHSFVLFDQWYYASSSVVCSAGICMMTSWLHSFVLFDQWYYPSSLVVCSAGICVMTSWRLCILLWIALGEKHSGSCYVLTWSCASVASYSSRCGCFGFTLFKSEVWSPLYLSLQGAYVNIDEFRSTFQVLSDTIGDGRPCRRLGNHCFF